jgi:Flp pilus assembly protein TadG
MRVIATIRRLAGDRRGAAAVEAALVMPMLLVCMAGMIDGGRAILQALQLQAAAQAGADFARSKGGDLTGVGTAATLATPLTVSLSPAPTTLEGCATPNGITPAKKHKDKCPGNTDPGTFVVVTAASAFQTLMPWPGLGWQPVMKATAAVRID